MTNWPVCWSCNLYWPIRGLYSGHMTSVDQWEASITWRLLVTTERSSRLSEGLYSRELEGRLVWSRPSGCCRVTWRIIIVKQKLVNPSIIVTSKKIIMVFCWGDYWVSSKVPILPFGFETETRTRAWQFTFMMTHFCVTLLDLSTTSEPNLWQIKIWNCSCKIYFLFHSICSW